MTKPIPPLLAAMQAGRDGMKRALDHANRVDPSWEAHAWRYMRAYVRDHAEFKAEDARAWAYAHGMDAPPDDRAWGGIVQRAAKAGLIRKTGRHGPSKSSHASPVILWQSTICVEPTDA
jgi:hypothetical protein